MEKPHWEKHAKEPKENGKNKRVQVLKNVVDTIQLKANYIRKRNNEQPESEEVRSMLDEKIDTYDLTRFERFKKWAKNNLPALSTVAITAAGVVSTIMEYGMGNENLRKMMYKDDSAVKMNKGEDVLIAKVYDTLKIRLGNTLHTT